MPGRSASRNAAPAPRRGIGEPADGVSVPVVQEQVLHGAGANGEPFANVLQSPPWRRENKLSYWPPSSGVRAPAGGPKDRVGWTTIHDGAPELEEASKVPIHRGQSLHGAGVLNQPTASPTRRGAPYYPPHQAPHSEKTRKAPRMDAGLVQPLPAKKSLNARHIASAPREGCPPDGS